MLFDENLTGAMGGGEKEPELGDYVTANTIGNLYGNSPCTIQGILVLKNKDGTVFVHHNGKDVLCSGDLTVVPDANLDADTRREVREARKKFRK